MSEFREKKGRKQIRVAPEAGHPVTVDINGDNFLEIVDAADISEDGIGISTPSRLEGCRIDEIVSLVITLPHPVRHIFHGIGKVKHISGEKFGVFFIDVSRADLKAVRRYVGRRIKDKSWPVRVRYTIYRASRVSGIQISILLGFLVLLWVVSGDFFHSRHASITKEEMTPVLKAAKLAVSSPSVSSSLFLPVREMDTDDPLSAPSPESIMLPVGQVTIRSGQGHRTTTILSTVVSGAWIALPAKACYGGSSWGFDVDGRASAGIEGGIWRAGDIIGMWKLADGEKYEGYDLAAWSEDVSMVWHSLTSGETREIEKVGTGQNQGYFISFKLPRSIAGAGIFIQNNQIVGWTFDDWLADGYLWDGPPGDTLFYEIGVESFYTVTFANGREEQFERALTMDKNVSVADRLHAFAEGFRFSPNLSPKETPFDLLPGAVFGHMRLLVDDMTEAGFNREVVDILGEGEILKTLDDALVESVIQAAVMGYGHETALALADIVGETRDPLLLGVKSIYMDWIEALMNKRDFAGAWETHEKFRQVFHEDQEVYLMGTELALTQGDWQEAEKNMGEIEDALFLQQEINSIKRRISELKDMEGEIKIDFIPGTGRIAVDVLLNGSFWQEMLVDTGASMVAISPDIAEKIGVVIDDTTPRRAVSTAGGPVEAHEVIISTLSLASHTIHDVKALVINAMEDTPGLLGLNYLSHFSLEMDEEKGRLSLTPR